MVDFFLLLMAAFLIRGAVLASDRRFLIRGVDLPARNTLLRTASSFPSVWV